MTNNYAGISVGVHDESVTIKETYDIYFHADGRTQKAGTRDKPSQAVAYAQELLMTFKDEDQELFSLWVQMSSKTNQYKNGKYVGTIEYGKVIWTC